MGRHWTEDSIRRELEAFLPGFDVFPSYPVFRASGRRGLWQAMNTFGGPERFAEEYGLPYRRKIHAIGDAEIRARLRAALRGRDLPCWPSRRWLAERAGHELLVAIERTGGPQRWADELGLPIRHLRGQRWTAETIAAAVEPLLVGRSTWPSRLQFERAGLSGLWSAIHHTEGHVAMAARDGLPLTRPDLSRAAPRARSGGLPVATPRQGAR